MRQLLGKVKPNERDRGHAVGRHGLFPDEGEMQRSFAALRMTALASSHVSEARHGAPAFLLREWEQQVPPLRLLGQPPVGMTGVATATGMEPVRRGAQYPSEAWAARQVWITQQSIGTSRPPITNRGKGAPHHFHGRQSIRNPGHHFPELRFWAS